MIDSSSYSVAELEMLELKRREAQLLRRRLQLQKENGVYFYTPWPKQDMFHAGGSKKYRLLRAGNRAGKSVANSTEVCAWLMGERVWYKRPFDVFFKDGKLYRRHDGYAKHPLVTLGIPQRPNKILLTTTDWDKVDEIWTGQRGDGGKLWKMLPRGFVKSAKRNHAGSIDTIECENGSLFKADTVQSFLKNPQGSESSDWDALAWDEPGPEDMWKAQSRGLVDRGGFGWFTLTPLSQRWINDMFFPTPNQDVGPLENRLALTASAYENPFLNEEALRDFEASLTQDEKECRILGVPLELSGLVYKEFDYSKHVLKEIPHGWEDYWTPPQDYVVSFSIDPHPQTPHAVIFFAVSQQGQVFIYDEIFRQMGPDELAEEIRRRVAGRTVHYRKCDPLAWTHDPITNSCFAEELAKNGLWVDKSSKAKDFGIQKSRRAFARPGFVYVNPHLKRFLFEINRYCYDKENKPIDKDDHLMEAMYRLFINELAWFDGSNTMHAVDDDTMRFDLSLEV